MLLVGIIGTLLIAERRIASEVDVSEGQDGASGLDAFTPMASTVPGSVAEKLATKAGIAQTEIFPLTMFALAGMMLFPASDDLLTLLAYKSEGFGLVYGASPA